MKLNYKLYPLICFLTGIIMNIGIYNIAKAENVVELSYFPLGNTSNGETITITAKLKVRNTGLHPIYNLKARLFSVTAISINVTEIFFGKIGPGGDKLGDQVFDISFNVPLMQETPSKKMIWNVSYFDFSGNSVIEEVTLR